MSIHVPCPMCSKTVGIPESLLGTKVRCPLCTSVFLAQAAPATESAQLPELTSIDDAPTHPIPPGSAVTIQADQEPDQCPHCGGSMSPLASRCRHCGKASQVVEDDAKPWEYDPRNVRRDSEPHRGGVILALGVTSLVLSGFMCCSVLGPIFTLIGMSLGITGWTLANKDLRRMAAMEMDPRGRGTTQAGKICSIVGTCLCIGGLLLGIGFILALVFSNM